MKSVYDRTGLLLGMDAIALLQEKKVLVFGIGGVGGYVVETLARVGIGTIGIVDDDLVDITNINRQIIALHSTIGQPKTRVMMRRIEDINPSIKVIAFQKRLTAESLQEFHLANWDYVVDAIDDVGAKLTLIKETKSLGIPIISSMGTGNKLDPTRFQVADIRKTHTCPLAKVIRKETNRLGIQGLKVVFSPEEPSRKDTSLFESRVPASIAYVPAAAGLVIASEVIKDLLFEH